MAIRVTETSMNKYILVIFGFYIAETLAYKRRTWQSSTRSHYSSDKAVDGKMTVRMGSGSQCAISGGNASETMWVVDLGGVYAISAIFIYFRIEESKIGRDN